jgi:betaine lipid synthase
MKLKDDLKILYNLWFKPLKHSKSHQDRLESFYSDQATLYDDFRHKFLWGREHMISILSAYIDTSQSKLVWVDMGGGTASNVFTMLNNIPLSKFKKIYIVDLCPSLCEQAENKIIENKWEDIVEVVCTDACTFKPEENAHIVTYSYSLSMIPNFLKAIDNGLSIMRDDGFMAITDFYVSSKYDQCYRQLPLYRRVFWKTVFDCDGIDIGPEKRMYVENKLKTLYEHNSSGPIPYVPFLRAPYYIWIGNKTGKTNHVISEHKEAPIHFPPTFLYHQSWEDPIPDEEALQLNKDDICLTLTSGGCNTLNLLLNDVKHVVSVDINPAQSALLELKTVALQELDYDDFWMMFGEGKHNNIDYVFEKYLEPFLSEMSRTFWQVKLYYFKDGLYHHGSMGKISKVLQNISYILGIKQQINDITNAETLREQHQLFYKLWCVRWFIWFQNHIQPVLLNFLLNIIFCNPIVTWYGGGVPSRQRKLIIDDGLSVFTYMKRCIMGMLAYSHLKTNNYFYYNILTAKYLPDNCPEYLKKKNFTKLRDGRLGKLTISTNQFIDELKSRTYTKVILMDHVDWQDEKYYIDLSEALWSNVSDGGKVIFRSASYRPSYINYLEDVGFKVICKNRIDEVPYMDRVNMYASFYVAEKPNIISDNT